MLTMLATQLHPGPWQDGPGHGPASDAPAWWPVFPITFGLFWVAVAVGAFYLIRRRIAANATQADPKAHAQSVLAERFARGDIDEDEYYARLSTLQNGA